jgi:hypothetical protein
MAAGSFDGEGGARNCDVRGLGARERAGEKCCWRVEKAGRWVVLLSWWVDCVDAEGGRMSVEAEGGKSCVRG